jgi:hypothetical protein
MTPFPRRQSPHTRRMGRSLAISVAVAIHHETGLTRLNPSRHVASLHYRSTGLTRNPIQTVGLPSRDLFSVGPRRSAKMLSRSATRALAGLLGPLPPAMEAFSKSRPMNQTHPRANARILPSSCLRPEGRPTIPAHAIPEGPFVAGFVHFRIERQTQRQKG